MYRKSVAALLLVAASVAVGTAPSASAAVTRGYRNVSTSLCLDSNTNGNVYTLGCNDGNFQRWAVSGSNARTRLKNVSTGFCLDSNVEGHVYTLKCNAGNFQRWTVKRYGDGRTIRFINVSTGLCLDSNVGGHVYTLKCNAGNFQKWRRR